MIVKKSPLFRTISCVLTFSFLIIGPSSANITDALKPPKSDSNEILQLGSDVSKAPQFSITDPEKIIIAESMGRVREIFKGNNGKLIINIQDAHCNFEAQNNISQILDLLVRHGLKVVALEGSSGEIDPSIFTTYPDEAIRGEVASYFLKKGKINGAEYLAITSKNPPQLYGVETKEYYLANLATFLNTLKERDKIKTACVNIRGLLEKLKERMYSKELKALDEKSITNTNDELKLVDYCWFLRQTADSKGVGLDKFANLLLLYKTAEIEKEIDFNKVAEERANLISSLENILTPKELEELFAKSVSFKSGRIDAAVYHVYLRRQALEKSADYARYPNLNLYTDYLIIYEKVDTPALLKEITGLETAIKEKLFANEDQRALDKLSKNIKLLENMIDISMSKEDVDYYRQNRNDFKSAVFTDFIDKQAKRYRIQGGRDPNFALADKCLPDLENFYRIAETRDDAILENTLKRMDEENTQVVALITGGYHTQGISERLRDRGISYVVIAPAITRAQKDNPYLEILSEEKVARQGDFKSEAGQLAVSSAMEKNGTGARDEDGFAAEVTEEFAKRATTQLVASAAGALESDAVLDDMVEMARIATALGIPEGLTSEQLSGDYGDRGDCGIFCHVGPNLKKGGLEPRDTMYKGAKELEHRGYQSSGCWTIGTRPDGSVITSERATVLAGADALSNAMDGMGQEALDYAEVQVVHERWPTTSPASNANQHPIVIKDEEVGEIGVVFNGDVTNFDKIDAFLAQEADTKGDINLKRPALVGTDAWTITALVYYFYKYYTPHRKGNRDDMLKAIKMAYDKMEGYFAVVVVGTMFPNAAFGFVKSDMPLYISLGENRPGAKIGNFFSSEAGTAIRWARYSQKAKDGDIAVITSESANVYRLQPDGSIKSLSRVIPEDITNAMATKSLPTEGVASDYKVTELNPAEYMYILEPEYEYFFQQEIWYQPQALAATIWGFVPPPLYPDKLLYQMSSQDLVASARYSNGFYQILIDQKRLPSAQELRGREPSVNQNRVAALRRWIENPSAAARENLAFPGVKVSVAEIRGYKKLFFACSGTSGHAAKAQKGHVRRMTGMDVEVKSGTEYLDAVNSDLRDVARALKRNGVKLSDLGLAKEEIDRHFPNGEFKGEAKAEDLAVLIKALKRIVENPSDPRNARLQNIPEMSIFTKMLKEAKETLGAAVSQSGGTKDTLNIMIIGQALGMKFLSIINRPGVTDIGSKTENDGGLVLTYAGTEKGVASTKAHPCQQVAIGELGMYFGLVRGTLSPESANKKLESLLGRPKRVQEILKNLDRADGSNWAKRVAKRLAGVQAVLYLGRGGDDRLYTVACEGALKMKEETYVMADAQNLGEMKHGPISFFPCTRDPHIRKYAVVILTDSEVMDNAFLNLREIIGRDGRPICVIYARDEKRIKGYLVGQSQKEIQDNERLMTDLRAHLNMMQQRNMDTSGFLSSVENGNIPLHGSEEQRVKLLELLRQLVRRGDDLSIHIERIERRNARLKEMEENILVLPYDATDEAEDDWAPITTIVPLQVVTLETVVEINGISQEISGLANQLFGMTERYRKYYEKGDAEQAALDGEYMDLVQYIHRIWNDMLLAGRMGKVDELKLRYVRLAIGEALSATNPGDRLTRANRLMILLSGRELSRVAFFENALEEYYTQPDFPKWDKGQLKMASKIMETARQEAQQQGRAEAERITIYLKNASARLESIVSSVAERQSFVAKQKVSGKPVENTRLAEVYTAWGREIGVAEYLAIHPDKPRGLAKIVTVEDRLPSEMVAELLRLGLSRSTIDSFSRSVMRSEGARVKSNSSFVRLVSKLRKVKIGEVIREGLFHEKLHNVLLLLDGFDKEELNRRVVEALDRVEARQRQQGRPIFTQEFRSKFGTFDEYNQFVEEIIIKYYSAKFEGRGLGLFADIGPELDKILSEAKIDFTEANMDSLIKVLHLVSTDAGTDQLARSQLRQKLPRNLAQLFDINFLSQFDVGGRGERHGVSPQIIKLEQVVKIATALGVPPRIEFEQRPELSAEFETVRANLMRRRVPQIDMWTPRERTRLETARDQLIKQGVTIPTDFEELYIGPEVNLTNIGKGTVLLPGTMLLGAETAIGEDCQISGTLVSTKVRNDVDIINARGDVIENCVIGAFCRVQNSSIFSYRLAENVTVVDSSVAMTGESSFGNGRAVSVGPETGGRNVPVYAEMTFGEAVEVALNPLDKAIQERHGQNVAKYVERVASGAGRIGKGTVIRKVVDLLDTVIGEYARLNNVGSVRNTTILSSEQEPTVIEGKDTEVDNSILQWGCKVVSGAKVRDTFVCEHSDIEKEMMVTSCIVAPNCALEEGEATSSLLGPFFVSHHQSLIIAVVAPQGRVNIGAGTLLGSNHPATRPDQEAMVGEGMFFGLGSTTGYPMNMSASPYTLVGRGVHLISGQRIAMPFSLVSEKKPKGLIPETGLGKNLLEPGAVNAYMVAFNESKYNDRNKARRNKFDLEVFRPEIVDMVIDAKRRLEAPMGQPFKKTVTIRGQEEAVVIYTDTEIPGLGKCFVTEQGRLAGIGSYNKMITRYALRGLKREIEEAFKASGMTWDGVVTKLLGNENPRWLHEKGVLRGEMGVDIAQLNMERAALLMDELAGLEQNWSQAIYDVRAREWADGLAVMDDYADTHRPPAEDKFIAKTVRPALDKITAEIGQIKSKMAALAPTLAVVDEARQRENIAAAI